MAKKAAERRREKGIAPMDVPISDKKQFFTKLGSRGGVKTKEAHGPDYYARIAFESHKARRANKAARKAEKEKLTEAVRRAAAKKAEKLEKALARAAR